MKKKNGSKIIKQLKDSLKEWTFSYEVDENERDSITNLTVQIEEQIDAYAQKFHDSVRATLQKAKQEYLLAAFCGGASSMAYFNHILEEREISGKHDPESDECEDLILKSYSKMQSLLNSFAKAYDIDENFLGSTCENFYPDFDIGMIIKKVLAENKPKVEGKKVKS